ncbi:Rbcn-3A [Bugula neritina]|uniref:Rbcn-3A n=1 Tax=Bugula neritina TaxID=10212 RepID=A0A7J7J3Q2_BUGNE|nr:Rbcn-3A [Bugula neritina]
MSTVQLSFRNINSTVTNALLSTGDQNGSRKMSLTERKISQVLSSENFFKMQLGSHHPQGYGHSSHLPTAHNISPTSSFAKLPHVPSIPSLSTIQSVKKCIAQTGNKSGVLQQKHLVQLDWAPTEDGGHVLTVAVGSKILFFSPVNNEIAHNAELRLPSDSLNSRHPTKHALQQSNSLVNSHSQSPTVRWMRLRSVELSTADGLPPLPMHVSWAKDGVLVVGMDNEMHVYSQWHGPQSYNDISALTPLHAPSSNNLKAASTVAADLIHSDTSGKVSTLRISQSVPHLHRLMASKLIEKRGRKDQLKRTLSKLETSPPFAGILECGLFEAVQITNPVLPQYHPKQLLELLNFGKVKRVKAILAHLMHCITISMKSDTEDQMAFRPRSMSIHQVAQSKGKVQVSEEMTSFVEISSIPPLPLYCLLAADNDQPISMVADSTNAKSEQEGYNELFSDGYNPSHADLDLRLTDDEDEADEADSKRRHSSSAGTKSRFGFGPKESETFANALVHVSLPGLNNLDQMYLMALANTVANTQTDFSDKFTDTKQSAAAVDDCGLRYVLAVGHDTYLLKTLSPTQRLQFQRSGFSASDIIWGFHSESEEEIVNSLPSFSKGEPTWEEARMFGVGWVITNINVLRRTVEKISKYSFQKTKDPMDSAIFYLAMKKKMVLWGLYRSVSDEKMQKFFKNDFTEDRWRKAALKNAYALLGLQRFLHAAAFFLLAGSLRDAVDICISKLNDLQLAIVISKLYSSDLVDTGLSPAVKQILDERILGGEKGDEDLCHPDPFLRSIALWMCKEYKRSLSTLLVRDIGVAHPEYEEYMQRTKASVFNFYNYLRTHPLLLRQKLASHADSKGMVAAAMLSGFSHSHAESDKVVTLNESITPAERSLYFQTAHDHFKAGCPALALEVLTKLPMVANLNNGDDEDDVAAPADADAAPSIQIIPETPISENAPNFMDFGATSGGMDWGASLSDPFSRLVSKAEEEPPSFTLSSDSDSDSDDEGGLVMKRTVSKNEHLTIFFEA